MATYAETAKMVLDWSNRDTDVLSYSLIKTFINFAADNAYRNLRVAPLEEVATFDVSIDSDDTETHNCLDVPPDSMEFIQLRKKDANSLTDYTVYAAKSDIRSFYQENTWKDYNYYTRQQDQLILYPDFKDGETYELYYYKRLPASDARYNVDTDSEADSYQFFGTTRAELLANVTDGDTETDPDLSKEIVSNSDGTKWWVGKLAPNWLRDQNEKILLFGALAEAFTYLDEIDQAQKYASRFAQEVAVLNDEENTRKYMGGNIQVHYQSHLI